MARVERLAGHFTPADSWEEFIAQAPIVVGESVEAMVRLLAGQDLLNVIELVRRHEIPMTVDDYRESESEQLPAVIDVVAIVALSLGQRLSPDTKPEKPTEALVSQLARHARDIVLVGIMLSKAMRDKPELGPLRDLAGQLVSHDLVVRGRHYERVSRVINREILGASGIQILLNREFGFDLSDVEQVAEAIQQCYQKSLDPLRHSLGRIHDLMESKTDPTEQEREELAKSLHAALNSPAESSTFTAGDLTHYCSVPVEKIDKILRTFSRPFATADPAQEILKLIHGVTSLSQIAALRDADGNHTILQSGISAEMVRPRLEAGLRTKQNSWQSYGRQRDNLVEKLAARELAQLFGLASPTYESLKYLTAPAGSDVSTLSADATDPKNAGQLVESDGLLVLDDVAVCLEVKAGALSEKARTGNVQRVTEDIRKTIGAATEQAQRLEELILTNGGIWRANGKWLDLSTVREVHTVVVCLEDFGPLAIAADTLVRGGILTGPTMPWIVSMHDLILIRELLDFPAQFLLYLRRRTDPATARLFVASDELDLLMWFLQGGLYFEPDPDEIHARYPLSGRPSGKDRARYRSQKPSRVGTFTDPLDAWAYYTDGTSTTPAPKPQRRDASQVQELVEFLDEDHKPGWLRFGADLLNLSGEGQATLTANVSKIVNDARQDRRFHSVVQEFVGHWGHALLFVSASAGGHDESLERLDVYMRLKKYQLKADRALGVHLDENGDVMGVFYLNGPEQDDPALDEAVTALGLRRAEGRTRAVPPSARRPTSRAPGGKRKKRQPRKR
ncbi:hypothetical protein LVY72_14095 [Arthrobacter sp. I2-34]|uniref:Uncharacterized protein n=1 Tax=Arthrobacter hankyongi TaxID=2904801 RepID=A0ABS9L8R8_9MICC|nr:hypothetical protein [Arthrobacter hankyongi]MCG2623030.1 hypothetical protein [Arthrobacter hankyongi]